MNERKTQYIIHHRTQRCKPVLNSPIFIDDIVINSICETKISGVYMDENLCWHRHISYVLDTI